MCSSSLTEPIALRSTRTPLCLSNVGIVRPYAVACLLYLLGASYTERLSKNVLALDISLLDTERGRGAHKDQAQRLHGAHRLVHPWSSLWRSLTESPPRHAPSPRYEHVPGCSFVCPSPNY